MSGPLKPDPQVRIAGREVPASAANPLVRIVVKLDMEQFALATLTFGGALEKDVNLGDRLEIDLGWSGERRRVFTGAIHGVEPKFPGTTLRGLGDEAKLSRGGPISQVFENQTHGQIVRTHAREAGVAIGTIEDGVSSPRVYRHRETRWEHCRSLALRSGFDLYSTEEGKLTFARFARRAADHVLRLGTDLLGVSLWFRPSNLNGVTVLPESPASSAGDDTASWFVKDPSAHSATEGDEGVLVVSDPSLRTRDAAKQAARAILERWKREAMRGAVTLVGRADIRLGEAVELKEVGQQGVDGLYAVRSVEHAFGGSAGFRTTLGIAKVAT